MAAEKGNKYAEKWTLDEVLPILEQMEITAQEKDCLYIGTLMVKYGLYRDIWNYWKDKFKDEYDVFRTIKRIEQIFENKLFSGGINGEYNPTITIFGLKNNHKWTDQPQPDKADEQEVLPLNIQSEGEKTKELAKSEQDISLKKDDRYARPDTQG